MNQVIAGASALILALLLWGIGKKPLRGRINKNGLQNIGTASLPQLALVETTNESAHKEKHMESPSTNEIVWSPPTSLQERIILQQHLYQLMVNGPESRLQAIILADLWGDKAVLPILRRGLKDSDSRVMKAAASAIQKYRIMPSLLDNQEPVTPRPPRNVALMR
ncbi:HEAT repeat domain-containing protein [Prochlorococcus sp. MIT 1307]|uniref:HEAT repeat domain-containing protein n=1 Tax=Prochlorococcus sp. MIT 1307 TaxID=3096219 RepID=UPI002A754B8F|nr:HEAT repeat domain-containing protein [Prochlorococcus sp. MIT 1307]